jgi:hypothetical protein
MLLDLTYLMPYENRNMLKYNFPALLFIINFYAMQ